MKYLKRKKKYEKYEPLLKKTRKVYTRKRKQEGQKSLLIKLIINFILFIMSLLIIRKIRKRTKNSQNLPKKILSKTKVAMCTLAKRENRYLKDFIQFYLKLGYNHIYFYDNNEIGDEAITDLDIVKEGIKNGYITVIDFKVREGNFQATSYSDCYEKYNMLYDWISFFDVDEYLMLEPKGVTIQEFMDSPRYNNCELVKFNWKIYTDNDQLDYIDQPMTKRFPIESKFTTENRHVKSIARGKLDLKRIRNNGSPHSVFSEIEACSVSGKKTDWKYYIYPPDYQFGWLNHYVTKSVREFFEKKYKTKEKVDVNSISEETKSYLFRYFFSVNTKTKEKVDVFNQIYNTTFQ